MKGTALHRVMALRYWLGWMLAALLPFCIGCLTDAKHRMHMVDLLRQFEVLNDEAAVAMGTLNDAAEAREGVKLQECLKAIIGLSRKAEDIERQLRRDRARLDNTSDLTIVDQAINKVSKLNEGLKSSRHIGETLLKPAVSH